MVGHHIVSQPYSHSDFHNNANQLTHCSCFWEYNMRSLVSIIMGYLDVYMAGRLYGGLP